MKAWVLCVGFLALGSPSLEASPTLNEVQASNVDTCVDEYGRFPDWLEIANNGTDSLDLLGYGLSDDGADPFRWVFPRTVIEPGAHLLVFASGEDQQAWAAHWETLIRRGDLWRYRRNIVDVPDGWFLPGFDDSAWDEGPSGFGNGDGDDATVVSAGTLSLSIRRHFTLEDVAAVRALALHIDYDDGFVAWINGVEVARANLGLPGEIPPYNMSADTYHEAQLYQGGICDLFTHCAPGSLLCVGENLIAIQVHNYRPFLFDLTMIPFLSLGLDEAPAGGTGLDPEIAAQVPHLHTDFRIDAGGEEIRLSEPSGALADQSPPCAIAAGFSLARFPDGGGDWLFTDSPSPEAENLAGGCQEFSSPPVFSVAGGFHASSFYLSLEADSPGTPIRYTRDGYDPGEGSSLYVTPLLVNSTDVIRARSFEAGKFPSPAVTRSFFFGENPTLPVLSLVSDPYNLWSSQYGIYVLGDDYEPDFPYFGANFWEDWERPAHLEYFLPGGEQAFSLDLGIKIHGYWSRGFAQKSLRLMMRGGYGAENIEYPIFPEKDIGEYHRLILRNSGNDWCRTMLRDGLIQRMAVPLGVEYQAYEPALLFINGDYWGIHNIRERPDESFLESNMGADPEAVDILESGAQVVAGDAVHYEALMDFCETQDLSLPENLAWVQAQMEVDNYADYFIAQIYVGNKDWPARNMKYWRPRHQGGRWRWVFYDTDHGLGLCYDHTFNTLDWVLDPMAGPADANAPWANFIFRKLLENDEWRRRFINRYCDYLESYFRPESFGALAQELSAALEPEIGRHMERWGFTEQLWQYEMGLVLEYIEQRPTYARQHLEEVFGLGLSWSMSLDVYPRGSGAVVLEGIQVDSLWSGRYYQDLPVDLTALPAPGYEFLGWADHGLPTEPSLQVQLFQDTTFVAYFQPAVEARVLINEINYHSHDDFDPGDWVELHNPSQAHLDLSGWRFKDGDDLHLFVLPSGTTLAPGGFLVLCKDREEFAEFYPEVDPLLGDLGFGFSGDGEALRLYDGEGALVDSVHYSDSPPWPTGPDGEGPTLELVSPDLDNTLAESWAASEAEHGTPGAANSVLIVVGALDPSLPPALVFSAPWPNPFNPDLHLHFGLPRASRVILSVFDVRGRRVAQPLRERLPAGYHRLDWRAEGLSSGLYLLRLETEGAVISRKALLLK